MNQDTQPAVAAPTRLARWAPGLASLLHYRRAWLTSDLAAGLSVAAVGLPVGIAYADLAGVPPVFGIYAAIFPLFAYALFGSSRGLMTGPDAATCILVAAILGPLAAGDPARYLSLTVVLTLMTGVLYVLAGLGRLGFVASFLSLPVLTGFLNGIALVIVVGQLPNLLGYESAASGFFAELAELAGQLGQVHPATAALGLGLVTALVVLRRYVPHLPNPLVVVVAGIVLVLALHLEGRGVRLLGAVPAGLPPPLELPALGLSEVGDIFSSAATLALVSFTSGILTAKSFAERSGEEIDPNRELIAFGAANLASGLGHGFPVTGADSRTAVNHAMGGQTQLVGLVAGGAMLLVLIFLTRPLAFVPHAALAAVIVVSAAGLFDVGSLKQLYAVNRVELAFSVGTTLGVLTIGVLPGVLLAVALSVVMLLAVSSRPNAAVLGRVPGLGGYHSVEDHPDAVTIPGLLLFRFEAAVVFYNVDYLQRRLLEAVARADPPAEWVIVDTAPVNAVDVTAIRRFEQLRQRLAAEGILLGITRMRTHAARFFESGWVRARRGLSDGHVFDTLDAAVAAFEAHRRVATAAPEPPAIRPRPPERPTGAGPAPG